MSDELRNLGDTPEEKALNEAIRELNSFHPSEAMVAAAAARVWAELSAQLIEGCEGFQALLGDFVAGNLPESRALLVRDHTRQCVKCRKALQQKNGEARAAFADSRKQPARWPRWAIAAGACIGVGLVSWGAWYHYQSAPVETAVRVESADRDLVVVSESGARTVKPGDRVAGGESIRTALGGGAMLRLADGSLVEVRERSTLSVGATRRDLTVRLDRGAVIVQAARRGSGHLYVVTRECRIGVTGTVFNVNSGARGSRVSVVEGSVLVAQNRQQTRLGPGEQYSTNPSLPQVPVAQEISWSRNLRQHLSVLRELAKLERAISEQVRFPSARYQSRLLDRLPADTVMVISLPNLGSALGDSWRVFEQQVQQSPVLQQWWESHVRRGNGDAMAEIITRVQGASEYLGEEVVIAAALHAGGRLSAPMMIAEARREGLPEYLRSETARLGRGVNIPADHLRIQDGLVEFRLGREAAAATGGFAGTAFYQRVAAAYREGVGILLALDLETLCSGLENAARSQRRQDPCASRMVGRLQHLLVERKQLNGADAGARAVLSFAGSRQGMAAWLAKPAPIGALDFVSPDATLAAAATTVDPVEAIDQILAQWAANDPEFEQHLAEVQAKLGFDVRRDLAGSLGHELVLAVDGPLLPAPAWKVVLEVRDPQRLQWTLEQGLRAANEEAAKRGRPGARLEAQSAHGRTYYVLRTEQPDARVREAQYTYVDGYLLAAPSRALIDQAIRSRSTGYTLAQSDGFRALLPPHGHNDFSAVLYQNAGPALGALVEQLAPEQRKQAADRIGDLKPSLVAAYGEDDQVVFATNSGLLPFGWRGVLGFGGPLSVLELWTSKKAGTRRSQ